MTRKQNPNRYGLSPEERATRNAARYKAASQTTIACASRRRAKHRVLFYGGKTCMDCPSTTRLEYHHRDPATKLFDVGNGLAKYPLAVLRVEIAKCDLICHACHARRHQSLRRAA